MSVIGECIVLINLALVPDSVAQPARRVPRIGTLSIGADRDRGSPLWAGNPRAAAVNLRTARALGLVIPPSVPPRADQVLE